MQTFEHPADDPSYSHPAEQGGIAFEDAEGNEITEQVADDLQEVGPIVVVDGYAFSENHLRLRQGGLVSGVC